MRASFCLLTLSLGLSSAAPPGLTLGEPVVVAEAPPEERRWGYYQFPHIERAAGGRLAVTFHVHADAAESYGLKADVPNRAVSGDGGRTWTLETGPQAASGVLLPNGDRLRIVTPRPFPVNELKLPAPLDVKKGTYSKEEYTLYRLRELPSPLDRIWLSRLPKGSPAWQQEQSRLEDPVALRYSLRGLFPIVWWGDLVVPRDRSVIAGVYPGYLEGQPGYPWNIFFYRSTDSGRSWKVQGRILYQPDPQADPMAARRDGFSEPATAILANGTIFCVMRSTDGNGVGPMYQSRSEDLGRTWTRPRAFTPTGVLPRLLRLGNGALLLSSGRPGVDVRVSLDGSGRNWTTPQSLVPITSEKVNADSCGYTGMVALDDHSALIAYSWFRRKGTDGHERKTIMVRRIEVKVK